MSTKPQGWIIQFTATRGDQTARVKMGAFGETLAHAIAFVIEHCKGQYDSMTDFAEWPEHPGSRIRRGLTTMSTAHQIPPTEAGLAAHDKTAPADCVHPVCSAVVECDGTTHYAGCACHERGWQNKWECAVEMAAQAEAKLATIEDIAVQLRELLWEEASGMMQGAMVSCPAECIAFAKWWIQKELGRKIDVPDDYPVFKPNNR